VPIYRVNMSFPMDTALPKDALTINPHFNASDPAALLAALKTNLQNYNPVTTHPFALKAYVAGNPPPNYPVATAGQTGTPPTSSCPREIALCLSYFSTYNRPRYRGRLYLPASWFTAVVNVRPSGAIIDAVLEFAHLVLGQGLPAQANWVMWSDRDGKSQGGVSDIWCDDEWDTIRSRGLSATSRTTGKMA
jgi:hypothetical protein